MEGLESILQRRLHIQPIVKRKPNNTYELAEKTAKVTGDTPRRWLKAAKNDPRAIERALIAIEELPSRNQAAHFMWWFKKYKGEYDARREATATRPEASQRTV